MNTNQKGFANILLIILVVILSGMVGYLVLNQKFTASSPKSVSDLKNNTLSVSLGQKFTLKKEQVAKIANTGLEVEIKAFYNNPCPDGSECFWSGIGIEFEYRLNGQIEKGVDLVKAFGYQTTIVETDNETYADLFVEKVK